MSRHNPRSLLVAGVLAFAMSIYSMPASAQPADTGLPFYVSDQFRTLARRAFREVVAAEIANACAVDKPLCGVVAARLAEAVDAALRKDALGLHASLDGFFFDSSANGLLQLTLSGVLETKELSAGEAVRPVARCLSAALTDKPLRTACTPTADERDKLLKLAGTFTGLSSTTGGSPAKADVEAFLKSLGATGRIDPLLALDALAAIVAQPPIRRPDVRIYLRRLRAFYSEGFDRGVSDALYRFLSASLGENDRFIEGLLVDYEAGATPSKIFAADALAQWSRDVATCGFKLEPLAAWTEGRVTYTETLRATMLSGGAPEFGLLDGLLSYGDDCRDPKALESIRDLKRFTRYFKAPIESYSALLRYGTAGLSVGALIDFVRDHDETRLERNLERAFVYGVAQLALQRHVLTRLREETPNTRLKSEELLWIGDALESCEIGTLALALGVDLGTPPRSREPQKGQCFSVVSWRMEPSGALPAPNAGETVSAWFKANRAVLAQRLDPLFEKASSAAETRGWLDEAHIESLSKAKTYLADGATVSARKAIIRIGLDLLMAKLDAATSELVGSASEDACTRDFKRTSIFEGSGAGCTAHLLIIGAYKPIADYYWATGVSAKADASQVTSAAYRGLLASPALDHTPLILNIGLGGTYVIGNSSVWGEHGYGALTVLDKIGVAFIKTTDERSQFEFGAYVGGFLDALIRTVASTGESQRYWQAGLTVGWPRISKLPIGFEAHAAVAMPFDLGAGDRYGFAIGASIVVPFSWFFNDKGD